MNLGQRGVYLSELQLQGDIMALQVAKINAHQPLQAFVSLPSQAGGNYLSWQWSENLAVQGGDGQSCFSLLQGTGIELGVSPSAPLSPWYPGPAFCILPETLYDFILAGAAWLQWWL